MEIGVTKHATIFVRGRTAFAMLKKRGRQCHPLDPDAALAAARTARSWAASTRRRRSLSPNARQAALHIPQLLRHDAQRRRFGSRPFVGPELAARLPRMVESPQRLSLAVAVGGRC